MKLMAKLADRGLVPDNVIRCGIRRLDSQRLKDESPDQGRRNISNFIELMYRSPIAIHTGKANAQHYEMAPDFFQPVLGKHLKYSACYWDADTYRLDDTEALMLSLMADRADLADGMQIFDLGCGC